MSYRFTVRCMASIEANADIAGPGTILAFLLPAILADILAIFRTGLFLAKARGSMRRLDKWHEQCDTILTALSDTQAFTGISIIVAAFIEGPRLSFYHEEIVVRYWWMIMNSFWCAQRRTNEETADEEASTLESFRKVLVIIAVCFGAAFHMRELVRQPRDWNSFNGDRCYRYETAFGYDDAGVNIQDWHAIPGTLVYVAVLSASLFPGNNSKLESLEGQLTDLTSNMWNEAKRNGNYLLSQFAARGSASSRIWVLVDLAKQFLYMVWKGTAAAATFCIHQYVAFWYYANGWEQIQVLLHAFESIYSGVALYKQKSWNRPLIHGNEASWDFGQCLPLILLSTLLFNLIVMFREKHLKKD